MPPLSRSWPWLAGLFLCSLPFYYLDPLRLGLFALLCLAVLPAWLQQRPFAWSRAATAWALWAGWAALSLAWSQRPDYTLSRLGNDVAAPLLLLGLFGFLGRLGPVWRALQWAAAVMLAAIAALLLGNRAGLPIPLFYPGWLQDTPVASTALVLLLPLLLPAWFSGRRALQAVAALLFALAWLAADLVGNRMFWPAAGLGLGAGLLWKGWHDRAARRLAWGTLAAVALLFAIGFEAAALAKPASYTDARVQGGAVALVAHSERYEIWQFWWTQYLKQPWFGVGFGRYLPNMLYAELRPAALPVSHVSHAHNLFFDVALQLGAVGLALFLCACAQLARVALGAARRDRTACAVLLALLVGWLAKNLSDDGWQDGWLWLAFSLFGAVAARIAVDEGDPSAGRP
ncbi:O-antigen ligase family protein [Chitinimonas koreensis]|uniref:O-antigen ligase family protein n=1 Tax=Chitinimonas koreensis TaxID=356302 RepID=UPI00041F0B48|nr:O-antigen ligase family protein [Chitinimonas koreensis]QNM97359.1 O-antigen ligase family protein [Chitinimonas koreensis]